jgi:hypothetical protein
MKSYVSVKDGIENAIVLGVLGLLVVVVAALFSLLIIPVHALILMLCWNYALTALFKVPAIGYFQSICLVVVFRILVRSGSEISVKDKSG